jgi:phospholipase C
VNDLDDPRAQFLLTNPSPANQKFGPFHARTVCTENLSPSWDESHFDVHIDSAHSFENLTGATYAMDRFLQTTASGTAPGPELYDPTKTRPLGYYDETDLPFYYELATQFSTSDAFHSPVLSNTNPNRMYLFSATSSGYTLPGPTGHSPFPAPTIFRALNDAGISWRYYFQDGMFLPEFQDWNDPKIQGATYPISDWYSILSDPNADNLLPQVVFIERAGTEQNPLDEHPDNNIQVGAADVEKIMRALFNSGAWHDSVFILTYDEGGGLFDHVPPFQEAKPDNIEPMDYPANENPYFFGEFNLSGFRVPVLVVSPWVKPHYVSHLQMDYPAILKMIETRFGLNPLTARDAAQPDMWREFFDFSKPNLLTVPSLPHQPSPATNDGGVCDQSLESSPNPPQ